MPSSMAPRFFHSDRVKHGQNGTNGVPYSREVARFALFGGRLPKVKVLTYRGRTNKRYLRSTMGRTRVSEVAK